MFAKWRSAIFANIAERCAANINLVQSRPWQNYLNRRLTKMMALRAAKMIVFSCLLTLAGCLAVGVPTTDDPDTLINYAYTMMNQGRPLPAKRFIDEALEKYRAQGNELGMAKAYHAYGNYYKNGQLGFKQYEESEQNFRKALELYEKNGNYPGIVKSYFGIGNTYRSRDVAKECDAYRHSLSSYQKGIKLDPDMDRKIGLLNRNFKTVGDMVIAFMGDINCTQDS
jgi:tetratricopeptide (TPR) repeat protein